MERRKRVVGNLPKENEVGRIDIEELNEDNEIIDEVEEFEVDKSISKGVIITYREPIITLRSGHEFLRSGGTKKRVFSPETHGESWKEQADQFIESCNTDDGERRPKYISSEEV